MTEYEDLTYAEDDPYDEEDDSDSYWDQLAEEQEEELGGWGDWEEQAEQEAAQNEADEMSERLDNVENLLLLQQDARQEQEQEYEEPEPEPQLADFENDEIASALEERIAIVEEGAERTLTEGEKDALVEDALTQQLDPARNDNPVLWDLDSTEGRRAWMAARMKGE